MLTKLATFRGVSSAGEPLVQLFRPGTSLTKLAGSVMPEVQQWLVNYKSDSNKIALLVNALGASEYWGQNINGDIFPEAALVHDCRKHPSDMHPVDDLTGRTIPAYGYPTFLQAYPYVHHRNKDPSRAFGSVVVSCWNPKMHRVELVVVLDRSLALQHGASGVVDRIDAGEYPDVSMGCKVPWDQCTICNHRSKTREDYCSCVKNIGLGRILDDGRRIGVINTYPRFFDISFVFIGADKTAKVMSKLGSSLWLPQSIVDADMVYDVRALCGAQDCKECAGCKVKAASVKSAESAETNDADPENMLIDRGKMTKPEPKRKLELPVEQVIFSRRDWQGERAGNGDGALATNMNSYADEDPWEKTSEDILAGGLADKKPVSKYSPKQMALGQKVEREHTNSDAVAREISRDHLEEIPDYYTRLEEMEDEAKKELGKTGAASVTQMFDDAKALKVGPPPQPNRKEFPFSGSINFRGIGINVENVPGSWRTGKGWKTLMRLPYGEFAKTKGMDGDKLDVYVGPYQDAANVYVVHQNVPQTGKYDEDKVMLGFHSPEQAKAAYLAHYNDPRFFRSLTTMSFSLFKRALLGGEMDGEKVASISSMLVKTAEEFRLEDLFEDRPGRVYRDRSWTDKVTGEKKSKRGSGMSKTASAGLSASELLKLSDQQKWADIVKEIGPDKAVGRVSPALSAAEPTMDRAMLDTMGRCGIESALATPSLLGMVLKPEEFQRLALGHMQLPNVADEFERDHVTFDPTTSKDELPLCKELDESQASDSLLARLKGLIESRSYLGPVVRRRMIRIMVAKPGEPPQAASFDTGPVVEKHAGKANSFLLSKLASAYNWYRREQIKVALAAPEFLAKRADLRSKVLGLDDADIFSTKTAEIGGLSKGQLGMVLGSVPLTLMYSSHLRDQERMGRQLGFLESMVAGNPWITSVGIAGVLRELLKSPQAKRVMQAAAEKVS